MYRRNIIIRYTNRVIEIMQNGYFTVHVFGALNASCWLLNSCYGQWERLKQKRDNGFRMICHIILLRYVMCYHQILYMSRATMSIYHDGKDTPRTTKRYLSSGGGRYLFTFFCDTFAVKNSNKGLRDCIQFVIFIIFLIENVR